MNTPETNPPVADVSPYMTSDEVSRLFSISGTTLRRLCVSGSFPAPVVVGRSWRFRREDVDAFQARGGNWRGVSLPLAGGISQPICGGPSDVQ